MTLASIFVVVTSIMAFIELGWGKIAVYIGLGTAITTVSWLDYVFSVGSVSYLSIIIRLSMKIVGAVSIGYGFLLLYRAAKGSWR